MNAKSQLTEIIERIDSFMSEIEGENGTINVNDVIVFLNELYEQLDEVRVAYEEMVSDMQSKLEQCGIDVLIDEEQY